MPDNLLAAWHRTLAAAPGAPALIDTDDRAWSRSDLDALAGIRRAALPATVRRQRVAFALPNGPAWLATFLALLAIEAVAVPLDGAEPPDAQRALARAAGHERRVDGIDANEITEDARRVVVVDAKRAGVEHGGSGAGMTPTPCGAGRTRRGRANVEGSAPPVQLRPPNARTRGTAGAVQPPGVNPRGGVLVFRTSEPWRSQPRSAQCTQSRGSMLHWPSSPRSR